MIIGILLKYLIVSIVISLLYGISVLSLLIIKRKYNKSFEGPHLFQFWSLILFIILWIFNSSNIKILETHYLWDYKNILLILICVIPVSIIVSIGYKSKPNSLFKIEDFLNGASLEIPQRLLAQNLFIILSINSVIYGLLTLNVLLNAFIWIQFIIVQEIINGNKVSSKTIFEIIASFWFSIWIGILYDKTGNIILAMLTYGLQRMITFCIGKKFWLVRLKKISCNNHVYEMDI